MNKWETTWVWYGDWRTIPLWPFYTFSWFPVVFCDCWPSLPAASCGCYKGLAGWRCPSAYWPASGSDIGPVNVYGTRQSYSTGTENYNQLILYKGKYWSFLLLSSLSSVWEFHMEHFFFWLLWPSNKACRSCKWVNSVYNSLLSVILLTRVPHYRDKTMSVIEVWVKYFDNSLQV